MHATPCLLKHKCIAKVSKQMLVLKLNENYLPDQQYSCFYSTHHEFKPLAQGLEGPSSVISVSHPFLFVQCGPFVWKKNSDNAAISISGTVVPLTIRTSEDINKHCNNSKVECKQRWTVFNEFVIYVLFERKSSSGLCFWFYY
jgi:hypothetical protein